VKKNVARTLGGHAGHAKDLLRQANWEIKQAAMVSNEHGH
jgi:hypothetical protein